MTATGTQDTAISGSPTRRTRAMVVTINFPPDAAVGTMRTLRLARHLADMGWDIDVVTMAESDFRPGTVLDAGLLERVPASTRVLRARALRPFERLTALVPRRRRRAEGSVSGPVMSTSAAPAVPGRWPGSVKRAVSAALSLPDRDVSWIMPAVLRAWRDRSEIPDVIYASGPPFSAHIAAALLARLMDRPLVVDFRDPWARAPWRDDRFGFERRAWGVFERFVVNRARAVVFVSEANRNDFARHYGDAHASRFSLVPNGCELGDFAALRPTTRTAAPFTLVHAGSLYGGRNPAALFRALANALHRGALTRADVRLRFIGRVGLPGTNLHSLVQTLQLGDVVEFVNQMPRHLVLQELVDASALLIVQPITTVAVPAKLYEYMAAGRPILALAEPGGETDVIVRRTGAGVSVDAGDEAAIEEALVALVRRGAAVFAPVDRSVYDGSVRAAEIASVLRRVIAGQQGLEVTSQVA